VVIKRSLPADLCCIASPVDDTVVETRLILAESNTAGSDDLPSSPVAKTFVNTLKG
jgi:hypothetical protein